MLHVPNHFIFCTFFVFFLFEFSDSCSPGTLLIFIFIFFIADHVWILKIWKGDRNLTIDTSSFIKLVNAFLISLCLARKKYYFWLKQNFCLHNQVYIWLFIHLFIFSFLFLTGSTHFFCLLKLISWFYYVCSFLLQTIQKPIVKTHSANKCDLFLSLA